MSTGQGKVAVLFGWEGSHRSDVTLTMCHRPFGISMVHLQAHRPKEGRCDTFIHDIVSGKHGYKTQIGYVGVAQKDPSQLPSRLLRHTVRSLRAARKMKASEMICYTSPWTVTMRSECVACTAIPAQHRNLQMTAAAAALPMRLSLRERCVKCKMTRNSHEQFSVCGILLSSMCMI